MFRIGFGHLANDSNSGFSCLNLCCPLCGESHEEENCQTNKLTCVNCKRNDRSAYSRSYPEFNKRKQEAIDKFFEKNQIYNNSNNSEKTYTRKFSDHLSNKELGDKITTLENTISNSLSKISQFFATELHSFCNYFV